MKETRRMHASGTALLAIVLLGSCSNRDATDGDKSKVSADRAHETSAEAADTNPQLRYTSGIRSIFEDSKGRFWFGSHQEGVCLYDGREFIYYTASGGLSDNQIRTIQEDQAGVMWFATGNGITSFDGDEFEIRTGGSPGSPDVAPGDAWHTEAGDLWFPGDGGMRRGIAGQGVYRYDGRSLSYLAFPLPPGLEEDNPCLVTGIVQGRDGTVWFGTYPGVFRYDGRSFTVINDETAGIETGLERFHVRCIFEDSRGNLWIGNNGLGVLLYDGQAVSNFTEQHGLGTSDMGPSGPLSRIFSIAEDAAGSIWFGTRDNGAWRFDGESLTNFTIKDGLTSPSVWTIYRDKREALWFGMGDGSVCRFNGESFEVIY